MLINAIRAENLKSRHSNMWVAVLILPPLVQSFMASTLQPIYMTAQYGSSFGFKPGCSMGIFSFQS